MNKLIGLVLFLISLPMAAQEMRWKNVTALNFAATNGTDKENALLSTHPHRAGTTRLKQQLCNFR